MKFLSIQVICFFNIKITMTRSMTISLGFLTNKWMFPTPHFHQSSFASFCIQPSPRWTVHRNKVCCHVSKAITDIGACKVSIFNRTLILWYKVDKRNWFLDFYWYDLYSNKKIWYSVVNKLTQFCLKIRLNECFINSSNIIKIEKWRFFVEIEK